RAGTAPHMQHWEGNPRRQPFRGSIAGLQCSLSTLRGVGYPTAARKTRFRLLAKLCRVGLVTHRVATKGFSDATASRPPFLRFPGAMSFLPPQTPLTKRFQPCLTPPCRPLSLTGRLARSQV